MSKQPIQPDVYGRDSDSEAGENPGGPYSPPDEPMGVQSFGTTRAEERHGESFEERSKHTEPEDAEWTDSTQVGRLSGDGDEDVDDVDDDAELFGVIGGDDDLSAEEEAVHLTDRP